MAELRKARDGEVHIEEAVVLAYRASYGKLPEDFPEDLKRLSFEKMLEHYLRLVEEAERQRFEIELARVRMQGQIEADKVFFGIVERALGAAIRLGERELELSEKRLEALPKLMAVPVDGEGNGDREEGESNA